MKGTRVFPRATSILRSVVIAGAGTAIWMALSATAASADAGVADKQSLLGQITSSISSVAEAAVPQANAPVVSIPVPNVPLPAPVKAVVPASPVVVPVPATGPVVQQIGQSVDDVVGTVPVLNHVVPAHTAAKVVDTVVPVTGHLDGTVKIVVPPVNDALAPVALDPVTEVANPVVQPIIDAVDTVLPPTIPTVSPILPGLPPLSGPGTAVPPLVGGGNGAAPGIPAIPSPGVGTLPSPGVVSSSLAASAAGTAGNGPADTEAAALAPTISATGLSPVWSITRVFDPGATVVGAQPAERHGAPFDLPFGPESVPAGLAGAGAGSTHNGPPPAAAFLHGALIIPADSLTDLATVCEEQHPKPVCFDPGSSPD